MRCFIILRILILSICLTSIPGTLFAQEAYPPSGEIASQGNQISVSGGSPNYEDSTEKDNLLDYLRRIASITATVMFSFLSLLYTLQIFVVREKNKVPIKDYRKSGVPSEQEQGEGSHQSGENQSGKNPVLVRDVLSSLDYRLSDTWPFFLLAFLFPILLSSINDVVPVLYPELDRFNNNHLNSLIGRSSAQILYFISVSTLSVLITLEFSYLYNIWKSTTDWFSVILTALGLDIICLLICIGVVRNPAWWNATPEWETLWAMGIAVMISFYSTFRILLSARTAVALHDGHIDSDLLKEVEETDLTERREEDDQSESNTENGSVLAS